MTDAYKQAKIPIRYLQLVSSHHIRLVRPVCSGSWIAFCGRILGGSIGLKTAKLAATRSASRRDRSSSPARSPTYATTSGCPCFCVSNGAFSICHTFRLTNLKSIAVADTAFWNSNKTPALYPGFRFINSSVIAPPVAQNNNYCDSVHANVAPEDSERWYMEIFSRQCGTSANSSICTGYE